MAKRNTVGYQAELLRRQGQRRIERLQAVVKAENTPNRVRNWATQKMKEIKSAMQGTRQYSKTGKRYRSKNENYIKGQMDRLSAAVKEVAPRYTVTGDSFEVTQRELNRASVKLPSVYTKKETQVFYRATQKIWQRECIGEHDRNEAILDHFNRIRKENGLSPMQLDEVVDYVLNANKKYGYLENVNPEDLTDPDARKFYEMQSQADSEDASKSSPVGQVVVAAIRDAMEKLLVLPDPTQAG